jgi:hypothetical protein
MNKVAITQIIAYYIDQNWALGEVQLTLDEVDSLVFSNFGKDLRTIGHVTKYCSKTNHTFIHIS